MLAGSERNSWGERLAPSQDSGVREIVAHALPAKHERLALLGVPIDNVTMDEAVELIDQYIQAGGFHQIATANVDFLMKAIADDELMDILHRCTLVLADGMPLVWCSRMMGAPLRERVTGADLVPRLVELSAKKSYGIFLLGAAEKRSAGAAQWMTTAHPAVRIVGRYSPPLASLEEMDTEGILKMIEEAAPDILMVAFGNPKQEKWISRNRARLGGMVCVGVGASLDFLSGDHQRAPQWMQTMGLEWFHRMYKEPRRLAQRYLSNATGLLRHMSLQLLAMSTQPRGREDLKLAHQWLNGTSVITITGRFTGDTVGDFERLIDSSGSRDCWVIIDLYATEHIGADALGALVSLSGRMREDGRELWLAGIRPSVRRVLRAAFMERHFRLAPQVSDAVRRIDMMNKPTPIGRA